MTDDEYLRELEELNKRYAEEKPTEDKKERSIEEILRNRQRQYRKR